MVHILHLEDSPLDQELVERALRRADISAQITRVKRFAEFVPVLASRSWDAVLADFRLPDTDGTAALKHVRENHPDLPFIFVSGVLGEETAIDMLKGGATDYVLKSRLQRLGPAVKRALQENEDRQKRVAAEGALKQAEERLLHVAKLESLGMMAGGIAHHFNNLMMGIIGHAGLIKDSLSADSSQLEFVDKILQAGNSAAQLTRQMLSYSGGDHLSLAPVDLSDLVRGLQSLFDTFVPKNIKLTLELQANLPLVNADTSRIQQSIVNLIRNACEATQHISKGAIWVRTSSRDLAPQDDESNITGDRLTPGPHVILQVADNGAGIEQSNLTRIFDPFFTTKFTGRGLGLASVLGAARSHKAGLQLRSDVGGGSAFTLLFPQAAPAIEEAKEDKPAAKTVPAETVLVIDDEPLVLNFIRLSLIRSGFQVLTAKNGNEALSKVDGLRFDLVLLDAVMPEMDGEQTLRAIRKFYPETPIIGMSGFSKVEAAERLGNKMEAFLQKPFTRSQLMSTVNDVLVAADRTLPGTGG